MYLHFLQEIMHIVTLQDLTLRVSQSITINTYLSRASAFWICIEFFFGDKLKKKTLCSSHITGLFQFLGVLPVLRLYRNL